MNKVAVSILSSNYDEEETINRINKTDAEILHVDVMDGHFVIQKTKEYEFLQNSKKPLQVHLMVSNPFRFIDKYAYKNTESIIFQIEIDDEIDKLLDYIKSKGIKCGLAINPETSIDALLPYIGKLDHIIIMTVKPGLGGQKMLDGVTHKIDDLIEIRKNKELNFNITVDGGINNDTINKVRNADILVSGSYICKSDDFQFQIDTLR